MTLLETFRRYHAMIEAIVAAAPGSGLEPTGRELDRVLGVYDLALKFKREFESLPREEFGRISETLDRTGEAWTSEMDFQTVSPLMVWTALALHVMGDASGRDAWKELASHALGRLTGGQQADGRFYAANPSANPESAWFDELATLHAAASYAVQAEDRHVASAVKRSSDFLAAEVQPDHATTQPWGLFAFLWNEQTRPLADQLLHAVELRKNELDAVSLILLRDALYCLELFL